MSFSLTRASALRRTRTSTSSARSFIARITNLIRRQDRKFFYPQERKEYERWIETTRHFPSPFF